MKTKNHGNFILASKIRTPLPINIFQGGPWTHLATVKRGLREYVCLLHDATQKIYLEEISVTGRFHSIEDDSLWRELLQYLFSNGIVGFVKDQEIVVGSDYDK
jgi:hypothetical protein